MKSNRNSFCVNSRKIACDCRFILADANKKGGSGGRAVRARSSDSFFTNGFELRKFESSPLPRNLDEDRNFGGERKKRFGGTS